MRSLLDSHTRVEARSTVAALVLPALVQLVREQLPAPTLASSPTKARLAWSVLVVAMPALSLQVARLAAALVR
jgi:hypothetical protein